MGMEPIPLVDLISSKLKCYVDDLNTMSLLASSSLVHTNKSNVAYAINNIERILLPRD